MESCGSGRPWGKLVKVNSSETVLLFNKECTVGRKKGTFEFLHVNETWNLWQSLVFIPKNLNWTLIIINTVWKTGKKTLSRLLSCLQHRPCCQCLGLFFKTSPLKTQRPLWCTELRQPLVMITKGFHWEHVCRILSRFFCVCVWVLLKKRLGLWFPLVSPFVVGSFGGFTFLECKVLALIGRPLRGLLLKLIRVNSYITFSGEKERTKTDIKQILFIHTLTPCLLKKSTEKQKHNLSHLFSCFHDGTLFSLQDVICPSQPTNWYRGSTARLCKMKAQDWCGWKTWGTVSRISVPQR